jgi:erythromycin esterase
MYNLLKMRTIFNVSSLLKTQVLAFSIFAFFSATGYSQHRLNLEFEPLNTDSVYSLSKNLPLWYANVSHNFLIDTTTAYAGKGSLLLESTSAAWSTIYTTKLPIDSAKGKILTVRAYAKKQGTESNAVKIYVSVIGKNDRLTNAATIDTLWTNNQWKQIEVSCPVNQEAAWVAIGVTAFNQGKTWFDHMQILLDGKPYVDIPVSADPPKTTVSPTRSLSALEQKWLQTNHIPLVSVSPNSPLTDLQKLTPLIGNAQIVGLGEVTHGSREIFQMKHRLVRFLVENKGFTVFALEADMAATEKINHYLLTGKGDVKKLLAQLGFWTWNTEEVLDLLVWMRMYNQKSTTKIRIVGIDMQLPEASLTTLQQFSDQRDTLWKEPLHVFKDVIKKLRNTPNIRQGTLANADLLEKSFDSAYFQLLQRIEMRKGIYLNSMTLDELAWLRQQLGLVSQFVRYQLLPITEAVKYRDACMAENLVWAINQYSHAKVALWAHNVHISKHEVPFSPKPLGAYLKENYPDKYINIGFSSGEGTYRGIDPDSRKVSSFQAEPAYTGTYEYFLQSLNKPLFLLDLRTGLLSKQTQWLHEVHDLRTIGAMRNGKEFTQTELRKEFDLLIFINKSSATHGL